MAFDLQALIKANKQAEEPVPTKKLGLPDLIARAKAAKIASESSLCPVQVFVDLLLVWDGWTKEVAPTEVCYDLACWLGPFKISDVQEIVTPSVFKNWQQVSISSATGLSMNQVYHCITRSRVLAKQKSA